MPPFSYQRPASPAEAVAAFAAAGANANYIAGGTTVYELMTLDAERPAPLVDVTAIRGLERIDTGGALRFGALAPMSEAAADPAIAQNHSLLSETLWKAASQPLRNMATVGGNLLQRTRCMYFRNGARGVSTGKRVRKMPIRVEALL